MRDMDVLRSVLMRGGKHSITISGHMIMQWLLAENWAFAVSKIWFLSCIFML